MSARRRDVQAIEEWLDEGPDRAPDRLLAGVASALGRTPQDRRNPMVRFMFVAAAVIVSVVLGGGLLIDGTSRRTGTDSSIATSRPVSPTPTPCGRLEVANRLLAPAGSTADISEDILDPPYRAVMGLRLSGAARQHASLRLRSTPRWAEEWLTIEVGDPEPSVRRITGEVFATEGALLDVSFVDEYVVTVTGDSGCVNQVTITTVRDTVLRQYDVVNNRTSPPPASLPRSPRPSEAGVPWTPASGG